MLLVFLMVILSGACQPGEAGSPPMPEPVTKGVMLEVGCGGLAVPAQPDCETVARDFKYFSY